MPPGYYEHPFVGKCGKCVFVHRLVLLALNSLPVVSNEEGWVGVKVCAVNEKAREWR